MKLDLLDIKKFVEDRCEVKDISSKDRYRAIAEARMLYGILAYDFSSRHDTKITEVINRHRTQLAYFVKNRTAIMDEPRLKTIYREFRDVYRFILSDTFIEETPFDALKALDKANAENNYMRIKLMDEMLKNKSTIATRAIPEEPTGADNLYMMFNSLPERLREDVKFKVETAYKINEKHKRDLNVIYTEG